MTRVAVLRWSSAPARTPTRFGFHSDIDLGVAGLPDGRFFEAAGELLLLAGEIDVDLIPMENATAAMAARLREGEVLYDKG